MRLDFAEGTRFTRGPRVRVLFPSQVMTGQGNPTSIIRSDVYSLEIWQFAFGGRPKSIHHVTHSLGRREDEHFERDTGFLRDALGPVAGQRMGPAFHF